MRSSIANPPFRPVLASAEDTSHFSVTQPASELEFPPCDAIQPVQRELWRHLPFLGYYYDARQKSGTRKEQLETAEHEPSDIAMSSQAEQPPAVKEHLTHSSSCALSSNLTSGTERLGHRLSLSRTPSSSSSASTASSSSLSSSSAVPLTPPSPLKTSPHSHSSASPRGLQAQETFQERLRRQREARQRMSSQVDGMRRKLDAFAQLLENEQCRRDMEFLECASQVMATLDPLLSTYPKQKQETFSNKRIQPGVASILSTFSRKTDGL
ncbi:hypothetical protein BCR43DRAFT_209173 [Syncephalastrum racemosum]|uniref:Uncharacterized protein n=1 Tax=Syncephalastrum racemosum TaxID=13706 RepID=A0A1X2HIJ7_SYNRA|nr:hypothetical protein BCR43DRAFT_209173 [Syncephalastrum racemosum]